MKSDGDKRDSSLYLLLVSSGRAEEQKFIKENDTVLVAPWVEYSGVGSVVRCDELSAECEKKIVVQLAAAINDLEIYRDEVLAFSNNFHAYTLRPVVALLVAIKKILNQKSWAGINIVCPRRIGRAVPMYGFKTTESLRGSASLFGAFVGPIIPSIFPKTDFFYIYRSTDFFCVEPIRKFVLFAASTILSLRFSTALVASKSSRTDIVSNNNDNNRKMLMIVRANHHIRFASLLVKEFREVDARVSVLLLPQFVFGRAKEFIAEAEKELGKTTQVKARDMLGAWLSSFFGSFRFMLAPRKKYIFDVDGLQFELDIGSIAKEMGVVFFLDFYRGILERVGRRLNLNTILSFELVGQMAGLESIAARRINAELISVQTALISIRPHVVFPFSRRFYTDSEDAAAKLKDVGVIKYGETVFAGGLLGAKKGRNSEYLNTVAYFTQPYESEITVKILAALGYFCQSRRVKMVLRFHPRDIASRYDEWIRSQPTDLLSIDRSLNVSDVLRNVDLCITRTSSVAKEALAIGTPIVTCLWSDFDRKIQVDYLDEPLGIDYRCQDERGLLDLLEAYPLLVRDLEGERLRVLGKKNARNLVAEIAQKR